jgi:hypothetical protein
MPTKLQDYECQTCQHKFEYLTHDGSSYWHQEEEDIVGCPECGSAKCEPTQDGGNITKCHDPDVLKETLKKRSADHTLEGMRKLAGPGGTLPKKLGKKGFQLGD